MKVYRIVLITFFLSLFTVTAAEAAIKSDNRHYQMPSSVMNIAKENTYPNPTQDLPSLQPSEFTKDLLSTSKVKIENPDLSEC